MYETRMLREQFDSLADNLFDRTAEVWLWVSVYGCIGVLFAFAGVLYATA